MSDDATSPAAVGRQLAMRRAYLDLTQDQLAAAVGVRSRSISAIERGSNAIQRSKRSAWEKALRLRPGTISRAYENGTHLEPADTPLADSAHAEDGVAVSREPSLSEVMDRMTALAEEVKELRQRDEERERQIAEEIERLRRQQSG